MHPEPEYSSEALSINFYPGGMSQSRTIANGELALVNCYKFAL